MANTHNLQVGMTVFLRPIGNALRRDSKVRRATISKVGRVYFEVLPDGSHWPETFHISDLSQKTGGAPKVWALYLNEQDLLDVLERKDLQQKIRSFFSGFGELPLSLDQMRRIVAVLEESQENQQN